MIYEDAHKTIAAIASGQMPAAIGVLRLSGEDAFFIIEKCLHKKGLKDHYMHYRTIYDPVTDEALDDVMLCRFEHPNSFTGEDTVEIYAHGGSVNLSRVLRALIDAGAVLAARGEFSQRAFLNGKLDLARAEAIMDVIHAQNDLQCREAHRQLSGSVSKVVEELRTTVMNLLVAVEASIDFSTEEELAPFPKSRILQESGHLSDVMRRMRRAHEQYRAGGLRIALVGRPNAGKSSLFNRLLGHDRAIVTDIAGTTTDTIEAHTVIDGHDFTLVDTAGLTDTTNVVEKIGVTRAREQISQTDLVLVLIPADASSHELDQISLELAQIQETFESLNASHRALCIRTKTDLTGQGTSLPKSLARFNMPELPISVVTGEGMQALEARLIEAADAYEAERENVALITSQRHITQLDRAREAIERAEVAVQNDLPAECVASDLHEAADALGEITGTIATDEVLNQIFSTFCIGK